MSKDMFHNRGVASEAAYFRQRDARLIEKLRHKAEFAEVAHALADKLQIDEPELLERIKGLGVTRDTGAAFILAPLVEVAWDDGHVTKARHDTVLHLAERRGVKPGSPDHYQIIEWLTHRPPAELFQAALEAIRIGISVLPPDEAKQRIASAVKACEEVARAPGGVSALLHPHEMSNEAWAKITAIQAHLEGHSNDDKRSDG